MVFNGVVASQLCIKEKIKEEFDNSSRSCSEVSFLSFEPTVIA
jgi:hypothetical protein